MNGRRVKDLECEGQEQGRGSSAGASVNGLCTAQERMLPASQAVITLGWGCRPHARDNCSWAHPQE